MSFFRVSQLGRDFPGQGIVVQVQAPELGEVAQECRDGAVQVLVGEEQELNPLGRCLPA